MVRVSCGVLRVESVVEGGMNQEQLDCLHIECKQWVDDGLDFLKSGITYGQALELIEALKEAQKDAERYRWVRSASVSELNEFCNMIRPHRNSYVDQEIEISNERKA